MVLIITNVFFYTLQSNRLPQKNILTTNSREWTWRNPLYILNIQN